MPAETGCVHLSVTPPAGLAIVATNKGSNGNGRRLDENGQYIGNHSPIHILQMPS